MHPVTTPDSAPLATDSRGQDKWWRSAVVYQVYPRSFADADGDGVGDIPGITARLPHLADLGVDAVWISPFYRSPQADAGYDVADYRDIDPLFGSLADADALIARARDLGIKVIVDLVPNHSSDEHAWFIEALKAGPGSAARERYIFRDGATTPPPGYDAEAPAPGNDGTWPPNNWESVFGGPAWTQVSQLPDELRQGADDDQWFLHMFDSRQPDFDWNHPQVQDEFDDILRFWARRGVDGFRVDVAHGLVKAEGLPNWGGHVTMAKGVDDDGDAAQLPSAPPMFDQDGVHAVYRRWRKVLDEISPSVALIAEAWVEPLSRMALYVREDEMQQAFNFSYLSAPWDRDAVQNVIIESIAEMGKVGAPATWVLSNHDVIRHASRLAIGDGSKQRKNGLTADDPQPDAAKGLRRALAATTQMLALPGSAYLYQGEEFGLPDHTTLPAEVRQDPAFFRSNGDEAGRDGCRIPIPWDSSQPALGFSAGASAELWLPQPDSYRDLAANNQVGVAGSNYSYYQHLLKLRREFDLGNGTLTWREDLLATPGILAFEVAGTQRVLVIQNYADLPLSFAAEDLGSGQVQIVARSADRLTQRAATSQVEVAGEGTVWVVL